VPFLQAYTGAPTEFGNIAVDTNNDLILTASNNMVVNVGTAHNFYAPQPQLIVNSDTDPTIALTVATQPGTTFVLAGSGTANFTTAGLASGFLVYIRNATTSDFNIQANGSSIAGLQSVLHGQNLSSGSGGRNSNYCVLYWDGTVLTLY
jgi:hypothetical protein